MWRHGFLRELHTLLAPRSYLEIGVQLGRALTLSRTATIGVDPAFSITEELLCDLHLVRSTSDEFFASADLLAHFPVPVVDLAFIDGMHLSEYALRDLINVERYTHPASVIVIDDMLPRSVVEASRQRELAAGTGAWAGDVYKLIDTLRQIRPDMVVLEVDTAPTGSVLLLLPDATSSALADTYDDIVEAYVVSDPQRIPEEIIKRTRAISPQRLLDAPIWSQLRKLRTRSASSARPRIERALNSAGLWSSV